MQVEQDGKAKETLRLAIVHRQIPG
jgi:hypothetical protein